MTDLDRHPETLTTRFDWADAGGTDVGESDCSSRGDHGAGTAETIGRCHR